MAWCACLLGAVGLNDEVKACVKAWVERSRLAQGLPPKVTDPRVLAEVADLLGGPQARQTGRKRAGSKRL